MSVNGLWFAGFGSHAGRSPRCGSGPDLCPVSGEARLPGSLFRLPGVVAGLLLDEFLVLEVVDAHGAAHLGKGLGRCGTGPLRSGAEDVVDLADAAFELLAAGIGSSVSLSTAISSRLTFTSPRPPRR